MNKFCFRILDQTWTVEVVPSHDANLYVGNDVCTGTMWAAKQSIFISNELCSERAMRTILHELCHAYIAATQANNPEAWNEEAICELFSIYAFEITERAQQIHQYFYSKQEVRTCE